MKPDANSIYHKVKKNHIDSKSALETKPNRREVTEKTGIWIWYRHQLIYDGFLEFL